MSLMGGFEQAFQMSVGATTPVKLSFDNATETLPHVPKDARITSWKATSATAWYRGGPDVDDAQRRWSVAADAEESGDSSVTYFLSSSGTITITVLARYQ